MGKGDTVKVKVGLKNNGPAWIGSLRAGGESIGFLVHIPAGATVTKSPQACSKQTGEGGYLCWGRTPMFEDAAYSYPFELRIDKVVPDAVGEVTLPGDDPHDPDQADNTAKIVLNGSDDQGSGSGGSGDGGDSGGGSGGDHGQSAGGSGDQGADDDGGGLALTGAGGVLLIAGVAAVALGAGGWFYLAARRRGGSGGAAA